MSPRKKNRDKHNFQSNTDKNKGKGKNQKQYNNKKDHRRKQEL